MKRTATQFLVIHTTAGNSNNTFAQVMHFFLNVLKWNKGGYHYIYEQTGKENLAYDPIKLEATNGILPNYNLGASNLNSIHLSYIGGINNANANEAVCNLSQAQEEAMIKRVKQLIAYYPQIKILGHNQINLKYCPSFWVPDWLRKHGIDEKNIYDKDEFRIKATIKALPHPPNFYEPISPKNKVCQYCKKVIA